MGYCDINLFTIRTNIFSAGYDIGNTNNPCLFIFKIQEAGIISGTERGI